MNFVYIFPRVRASLAALACTAATVLLVAGCGPAPVTSPGGSDESTGNTAPQSGETAPPAPDTDAPDNAGSNAQATADSDASGERAAAPVPAIKEVDTEALGNVLDETVGKVTVLNMWATWCKPCVHETPDLVTFYNETDRDQVAFVSVSIDDVAEISGAIPEFQQEHNVPFPIYVLNERDDAGLEAALRGTFGGAVPATYIYDQEGKLVKNIVGTVTAADLHEAVADLL